MSIFIVAVVSIVDSDGRYGEFLFGPQFILAETDFDAGVLAASMYGSVHEEYCKVLVKSLDDLCAMLTVDTCIFNTSCSVTFDAESVWHSVCGDSSSNFLVTYV